MSIVKEEYRDLLPHGERLCDVVVLAQAWKKSHTFIRTHNWYADVLELDTSTIDLENRLETWAEQVKEADFRPKDLLLVPAPKNTNWCFRSMPNEPPTVQEMLDGDISDLGGEPTFEDWAPKECSLVDATESSDKPQRSQKLRPLAHLCIRDQTLATAVMMCLAEVVESAQGDTSATGAGAIYKSGVVSYGNRLHCTWVKTTSTSPRAEFSWGNSRTYRQFFQDYRAFLARPRRICMELASQLRSRRELFVVSLDIKSFFDQIDRNALIEELKLLECEHRQEHRLPDSMRSNPLFWERTTRIISWQWREEDLNEVKECRGDKDQELEVGLPQGLVASGFFANAYLVRFDRDMQATVSKGEAVIDGMCLLDYCRYVDDMRLVVEVQAGLGPDLVLKSVKEHVTKVLVNHCRRMHAQKILELSEEKCVATSYRTISAQSHISDVMEMLNAEMSGTFDLESLTQVAGGLDGLLWASEQIENTSDYKPSRLALASIALPNTDVRDDTVKRFVATRIAQLMRHRLTMTDLTQRIGSVELTNNKVTKGMVLAHEFEARARRLIKCWAENPALGLLLRCGLDLFPHPRLLSPVIEALSIKLFNVTEQWNPAKRSQIRVAEYILADLLRAGAVETGLRHEDEYPTGVDIQGYQEELGGIARRILSERQTSPWYLRQQALLFLSSIGDTSLAALFKNDPDVEQYGALQDAILFKSVNGEQLRDVMPIAIVGQQLRPNPSRFGVWLSEGLNRTHDENIQSAVVGCLALNRPDLLMAALNGQKSPSWRSFVPTAIVQARRWSNSSQGRVPKFQSTHSLLQITSGSRNYFDQENAVLMLAEALLSYPEIERQLSKGASSADIILHCEDWAKLSELPDQSKFLYVKGIEEEERTNPLYDCPSWVKSEKMWLYGLGRILRSALTGEFDFTSRRYLVTEEIGRYSGLRSTWFNRRFGLINSGRGLLDEPGPVSPWLSDILSTLLQWPGVNFCMNEVSAAGDVNTAAEMLVLIQKRIAIQRELFGRRSKTPVYVVPVDERAPLQDRPLRVAIVQPLRPKREEFSEKDPTHWTPGVLAEHRRHLAEVCRLTHQKLKSWASANPIVSSDKNDDPMVDIILFPELAVHPEHISLLRRLSDKVQANIFAGLTFLHSHKAGGVVNQGLWLIRTSSPEHGRAFQYIWQGKQHPMKDEARMGVKGYRPHLTLVELPIGVKSRTRIAAAICYDATDLDLVTDLRDKSDVFLVAALNQDVQTFDNMVAALHFHMYQPVILANSGEFGGSTAQVPIPKHDRLIAHVHGNRQIAVSVFEVDPSLFKSTSVVKSPKVLKTPPAGYKGRS
ncbi:reverse transcriptase domain-containing protein [Alcaligenes faecalis]|uniref:Reverse transcriptase domain-containing protein n=1 Tax=Alcaligenes faecalis TaxID=511 RepID=A0ABY7MX45_ALCFA|nr:reverse transcriptase domain-containing protein [Alcaligenes faecalis]WBM36420.1 reverse transcriptase domain-containing protein [Alcaligenes faecalis]